MLYVVSSGPTYIVRSRLIKKVVCSSGGVTCVTMSISRSECTYQGQMVYTEVRWYIQRSDGTYKGQSVHTEVRRYIQRSEDSLL